jgi:hypothetical protein
LTCGPVGVLVGDADDVDGLGAGVEVDDDGLTDGLAVGVELADADVLGDGVPPWGSQSSTKPPLGLSVFVQFNPWLSAAAWRAAASADVFQVATRTSSNTTASAAIVKPGRRARMLSLGAR